MESDSASRMKSPARVATLNAVSVNFQCTRCAQKRIANSAARCDAATQHRLSNDPGILSFMLAPGLTGLHRDAP